MIIFLFQWSVYWAIVSLLNYESHGNNTNYSCGAWIWLKIGFGLEILSMDWIFDWTWRHNLIWFKSNILDLIFSNLWSFVRRHNLICDEAAWNIIVPSFTRGHRQGAQVAESGVGLQLRLLRRPQPRQLPRWWRRRRCQLQLRIHGRGQVQISTFKVSLLVNVSITYVD